MTVYLLDTNVVSDMVRNPQGNVVRRLSKVGEGGVATSIIVACELRFGVERTGSARLAAQLEAILALLPILQLGVGADLHYGRIRNALERKGEPIGANDLLIAAHAVALDAILVTANPREFERIDGLVIENWLQPI